jgi:hypothetical protein
MEAKRIDNHRGQAALAAVIGKMKSQRGIEEDG